MKGTVFDIQRNSLNDGPGIRTTVFLKGCSLNCLWCHNEESIDARPALRFFPDKCKNCLECVRVCRPGAHFIIDGKHHIDFTKCARNWDCTVVCPSGALARTGDVMEVEEVVAILLKDKAYYMNSGGGITISGGEPMVQFRFTKELLKSAKSHGLHTCLDTTGNAPWKHYTELLPFTDIFLYDYKESEPAKHMDFTGTGNKLILENLQKLNEAGAKIILRCPLVPGLNDREDHFEAIARLSRSIKNIDEVHILPYHSMGLRKAEQHGARNFQNEFRVPDQQDKDRWRTILTRFDGKNINIF